MTTSPAPNSRATTKVQRPLKGRVSRTLERVVPRWRVASVDHKAVVMSSTHENNHPGGTVTSTTNVDTRDGWGRRLGLVAAGVTTVVAIGIGIVAANEAPMEVGTGTPANPSPPPAPTVESPAPAVGGRSALLNGWAFDDAVAEALASTEARRSALLDGLAFDVAIAQATSGVEPFRHY